MRKNKRIAKYAGFKEEYKYGSRIGSAKVKYETTERMVKYVLLRNMKSLKFKDFKYFIRWLSEYQIIKLQDYIMKIPDPETPKLKEDEFIEYLNKL